MGALNQEEDFEAEESSSLEPASFFYRFGASFIDSCIIGILYICLALVLGFGAILSSGNLTKIYSEITALETPETSVDKKEPIVNEQNESEKQVNAEAKGEEKKEEVGVGELVLGLVFQLLTFLVPVLYSYFTMKKWNATLGKKMVGLKVLRKKGEENWTIGSVIMREYIGKMISGVFYAWLLRMVWDDESQTWHDKIAKSHVVVD